MGIISAVMQATTNISGMSDLMPDLWFDRVPDRSSQPPFGILHDEGRDPLIQETNFETAQVMWQNLTFEFRTTTLADCEAWVALMDSAWAFGALAVAGYGTLEEGTEVGRVVLSQEPPRDQSASLIHKAVYPVRFPVVSPS